MNKEYMLKQEEIFPFINNRNNFLLKEVPQLHPSSKLYLKYWREQKRRIIEGYWGIDDANIDYNIEENDLTIQSYNWRWMPPALYFYVNFGTIKHNPKGEGKTAAKKLMRPYLRDIEWAFFYNYMECRGFSGFDEDENYSCCLEILSDSKTKHPSCFKSNGELKEYIPARDYLRKLWDKPVGLPLYENEAKNMMLLACRGLGKSVLCGVGVALHELLIDGARRYNTEIIRNPAKVEIFVGAALTSKSAEILAKTKDGLYNLPGAWKGGTTEEIPAPFYKEMTGTLSPNNFKSPWIHSYAKKIGGSWQKVGSESKILHGIFTAENPETVAGTRPGIIIVEEVGLLSNILTVHGSNTAAQARDGTIKFGSSFYIGTSGNMEKIVESEIIFKNPDGYDMLSFDDVWESSGKIGWFIPADFGDNSFKDENGNTIRTKAKEHYIKRREKLKYNTKSSVALDLELMNYPLVPSEMFLTKGTNKFPINDLKSRLGMLLSQSNKVLEASWKGRFDLIENKPKWVNTQGAKPIWEFPVNTKNLDNTEGCIELYYHPKEVGDSIPHGRYIVALDPVDDDGNEKEKLSLQCTYVFDTWQQELVAEYIGRTRYAKEYYEQVRRLCMYYNANILYENQKKGFYPFMQLKKSLYMLADTPEFLKDIDIQRPGIGNTSKGIYATDRIKEWGTDLILEWLESQAYERTEGVTNLQTLRSPGLIKELTRYGNINTDRVSSLIVLMIYWESLKKFTEKKTEKIKDLATDPFWSKHYKRAIG